MIKIYLSNSPSFAALEVYIVDIEEHSKKKRIVSFDGAGGLIAKPFDDFELPPPTMRLSGEYANDFLKGFAEAASERGIKLESDLKREGKLEAVQEHLADMRKLVFSDPIKTGNEQEPKEPIR